MKVLIAAVFLLSLAVESSAQGWWDKVISEKADSTRDVSERPERYFGPFRINGERPEGFKDVEYLQLTYKDAEDEKRDNREALVPDAQGNVAVTGWLVNGAGVKFELASVRLVESGPATYLFQTGKLLRISRERPITLEFTTAEVEGIKYSFRGEFLDEPEEGGGGFAYLKGTLAKLPAGKTPVESRVSFDRYKWEQ